MEKLENFLIFASVRYPIKERKIIMDTTMNQGVFLSIPKSDMKFFKELAKKMGWDIDIREDFLKDYIASRPKKVNLSEEDILAELNAIRYGK